MSSLSVRNVSLAEVQAELVRLQRSSVDGLLKAEDVVESARDESSPIHEQFEWDDSVAAQKFRVEQARTLIRRFRVTLAGSMDPVPFRVSLIQDRQRGGGYREVTEVVDSPQLMEELLRTFKRELMGVCRRYSGLFPKHVAAVSAAFAEPSVDRLSA